MMFVCRFEPKEKEKNKKKNEKAKGKIDVARTCCFSKLKRL
jgi:hypothetical protein